VPAAVFLVDIGHEHIALKEAQRLNVNTFGLVDTNCDPTKVDFAIPGNDDASKSIFAITNFIADAIAEGLSERETDAKDDDSQEEETNDRIRFDGDGDGAEGEKKKSGAGAPRKRSGKPAGGGGPRK
jgi:small subunit ribosomal protein S2